MVSRSAARRGYTNLQRALRWTIRVCAARLSQPIMRNLRMTVRASFALVAILFATAVLVRADDKKDNPMPPKSREPVKLTEEALRIQREALLVDGHNDLPWQFREKSDIDLRKIDLRQSQKSKGLHTDIP